MAWYDTDAAFSLNSAYTETIQYCLYLYKCIYNLLYTILFSQTETSFQKG